MDGNSPFRIGGDRTLDLVGLGEIDTTMGLGAYAEYEFGKLSLTGEVVNAISSHNGLQGEVGLRYNNRIIWNGPPLIYSFGPNIKLADNKYHDAFFGITPSQASLSGLDTFDADGGILSVGFSAAGILPLTEKAALTMLGGYQNLTADAADSPLVRDRGSRDQLFFGLILSYNLF